MFFKKYLIIVLFLFLSYGCNKEIVRENKPIKKDSGISQIVKSDIDNVLEVHINKSRKLLKELMKKLYKRNPRELKKSRHKIAEENIVRLFDFVATAQIVNPSCQGDENLIQICLAFKPQVLLRNIVTT